MRDLFQNSLEAMGIGRKTDEARLAMSSLLQLSDGNIGIYYTILFTFSSFNMCSQ